MTGTARTAVGPTDPAGLELEPTRPAAAPARRSLGPLGSLALVAAAVAVAIAIPSGIKHGPIGPWSVAVVVLVLAACAGTGRLWLPANPLLRHLSMALVAGGLLLWFSDHVSSFGNYQIAQVAYYLTAVAGLTVLTGLNGQLSLGHGALMAVGAYTVALLTTHQPHVAIVVALLIAIGVTAAAGLVVGIAAARLRGPYLAGATLALALAVPEVAIHFRSIFGADQGKPVRPLSVPGWLPTTFPPEKWLAWLAIVSGLVTLVLLANVTRSGIGRRFRCVRDDETSAALAGINVARTQILAFVLSAGCAGLAGALYGFWAALVSPGAFGLALSLALLTAIVIGGVGSLTGAVWGAIALVFIPKYTDSASKHFHLATTTANNLPLAIYGLALIAAMLLFPTGIQGALRRLARLIFSTEHQHQGEPHA